MTAEENKAFVKRYLAAISGKPKPPEVLDRFTTDEELKKHIAGTEAAFPLYRLDPEEIIAEGDLVSVRGSFRGTHKGPFQGVPPTGREISGGLFITYRVSGGRITEHWMLVDSLAVLQQLGVLAEPAKAM
jgi:predicted ester cyclase